jgi:hypothetical protein
MPNSTTRNTNIVPFMHGEPVLLLLDVGFDYLQLRKQQPVLLEHAWHHCGAIRQQEDIPGRRRDPDLRRVGRRGREELRGRPGDAVERLDARGGPGESHSGALLLVDLVEERLDLAAQERLPGAGRAAEPGAGLGGGGGGGLVVEASRGEADDGGVVGDVVQRGALPSVLGAGEVGGGGVCGALLLWVKENQETVVRKHVQKNRSWSAIGGTAGRER